MHLPLINKSLLEFRSSPCHKIMNLKKLSRLPAVIQKDKCSSPSVRDFCLLSVIITLNEHQTKGVVF